MSDPTDTYLWQRRHEVLYQVQLSTLYHRRRERFMAFWDRTIKAIAIIGGTTAFAEVGGADVVKIAAAIVAGTATIGLVFGLEERARLHSDLARRFLDLEARILRQGERDFTEEQVAQWAADLVDIQGSEPPVLGALVVICQNDLARAAGQMDAVHPIGWWRRLTRHFVDMPPPSTPAPA